MLILENRFDFRHIRQEIISGQQYKKHIKSLLKIDLLMLYPILLNQQKNILFNFIKVVQNRYILCKGLHKILPSLFGLNLNNVVYLTSAC